MTVRNTTFTGHETDTGQGGGISNVAKAELEGVTIEGNRAGLGGGIYNSGTLQLTSTTVEGNRAECSGGGIFNSGNGKLDIKSEKGDCKISHNEAVNAGGDIHNEKGAVTIRGGEIISNLSQSGLGGGIFTYDGSLEIHTAVISRNTAAQNGGGLYSSTAATLRGVALTGNAAYGSGGGAYLDGVRMYMVDVTFDRNKAEKDGGGIYNAGTLRVEKGKFSSNENRSGFGSGIFNESIAEVVSSTFAENLSNSGGGGIYNKGPLTITGCTFSRNGAGGNGGAIYNKYIKEANQEFKIVNSTLSGNMTDSKGGGIYNEGTEAIIISSTLSDNTALGQRDNICNNTGLVKLQNTLIAGKSPGNNCTGTCTSVGYNLSSDGSCGLTQATDLTNTDPLIGALADNGGSTQTHALLTGSPAINKIPMNVNGCGTSITTDRRGTARPQPSTGNCDVGAYERTLSFNPAIHKVK